MHAINTCSYTYTYVYAQHAKAAEKGVEVDEGTCWLILTSQLKICPA